MSYTEKLRGLRIVVVGGSGFIGGHIVEALRQSNDIVIYDNLSRSAPTFAHPVTGIELVKGNVLDYHKLCEAIKGADVVFNLAAIAGIDTVTKRPLTTMEVNLIGAYNVFKAAAESRVDRVVFSSTSEVYGPRVFLGKETDGTNIGPINQSRWGYAVSKLAAEFLAHNFYAERRLKTVVLRYFNVYGPNQVGEGAIHNFVLRAIKNEPLQIYGNGLQIRAWIYIDDVVNATLSAAVTEDAVGRVFNVGNPATACTIRSLAERIIQISNSQSRIEFVPKDIVDVELRVPDITLAQHILGFQPKYSLDNGLKFTIAAYRSMLRTEK